MLAICTHPLTPPRLLLLLPLLYPSLSLSLPPPSLSHPPSQTPMSVPPHSSTGASKQATNSHSLYFSSKPHSLVRGQFCLFSSLFFSSLLSFSLSLSDPTRFEPIPLVSTTWSASSISSISSTVSLQSLLRLFSHLATKTRKIK